MRLPKLFQSSTFRLALIYMGIFGTSVLLLLVFIYWSTAGYMLRQTEATIEAEITGLAEQYDHSGLPGLSKVIRDRLSRQANGSVIYLLADGQLKPILGNLEQWPKEVPTGQGWLSFRIERDDKKYDNHQGLARVFRLRDNFHLLVGRDIHDLEEIQSLIREALFWGLLITVALALAGGTMMSRAMMRRIEIINTTCQQIMGGELSRRIPHSGGEDDFDKLVDNLNLMLDRIEDLMLGVKQVTNNIAHDLRTPLTRLQRRLDMLRESSTAGENNQELLDQAIVEADGLLLTFKALLRISEIETGSRRSEFDTIDVAQLLKDLIEFYEPLSEDRSQVLSCECSTNNTVIGDRDLLFQAFSNLLDNAIKYTPAEGQVRLETKNLPECLQVIIRDSGPGVPVGMRQKIFERFFRLEESRSTPGNGLGLSLVAAIIKLHHGQIELLDNNPGLTVVVSLPKTQDI